MQAELLDIRNHIAQYPPFNDMPEELLERVVSGIEVVYYRAGTQILELGQTNHWLHYIRSGAVEIFRRSGELYNRVGEGEIFGQFGLMMNKNVQVCSINGRIRLRVFLLLIQILTSVIMWRISVGMMMERSIQLLLKGSS